MIHITDEDWVILKSHTSVINRNEIFKELNKVANFQEMKELLMSLKDLDKREREGKFSVLYSGFPHSMDKKQFAEFCRFFLLEKWHHQHEEILEDLSYHDSYLCEENVDAILALMNDLPDFYKAGNDLKYPFIRKCLYAIEGQPKPYSSEGLREVYRESDELVKGWALYHLISVEAPDLWTFITK